MNSDALDKQNVQVFLVKQLLEGKFRNHFSIFKKIPAIQMNLFYQSMDGRLWRTKNRQVLVPLHQ